VENNEFDVKEYDDEKNKVSDPWKTKIEATLATNIKARDAAMLKYENAKRDLRTKCGRGMNK
jgi:hypothetical protein